MTITTAQSISGGQEYSWLVGPVRHFTITPAQSVSGGQDYSAPVSVGPVQYFRESGGVPWLHSPVGFTGQLGGLNQVYSEAFRPSIQYVTAGFDPVIVAQLTVVLRDTGQIWPAGYS